jgi:hypothetical protein
MSLILVDALITKRGLLRGLREVNPVLSYFSRKFDSMGLIMTRAAALGFLLLLFSLLDQGEWLFFSFTFAAAMGRVILVGVRRSMSENQ